MHCACRMRVHPPTYPDMRALQHGCVCACADVQVVYDNAYGLDDNAPNSALTQLNSGDIRIVTKV